MIEFFFWNMFNSVFKSYILYKDALKLLRVENGNLLLIQYWCILWQEPYDWFCVVVPRENHMDPTVHYAFIVVMITVVRLSEKRKKNIWF